MDGIPPAELLRPAVDAGRAALRALDDEEVPAPLRRVAGSSARRLPPPFADALLAAMDRDDWLRSLALEEAAGLDEDGDPAEAVSALFLRRPEGWRERVDALVATQAAESEREGRLAAETRVEVLESRVTELEEELAEARSRVEAAFEQGRAREVAAKERLEASLVALRREVEAERARADAEALRAGRLAEDLAEADARIGVLRERANRRKETERPARSAEPSRFGGGTPIETARALDQLASAMRPAGRAEATESPREALAFPAGVRPDRREAVSWLLESTRPLMLVIDGYNVAHDLAPVPDRSTRERVNRAAGRIRRLADGPVRVVVIWDSDREPGSSVDGAVWVRFVPHADDAITEQVEAETGDVVVVTSDRELRERVERAGGLALWSSALIDWMRSG
jgi:hypothetical protein